MTFNPALTYAEVLCKLCFKCHMYLQYILDSVSEFNGYYMVRRLHRNVCLCIVMLFCTYLTFDLILRHRDIFRLGIHPYRFCYTYKNIISMDASFYPILPSEVFFHGIDCQLYGSVKSLKSWSTAKPLHVGLFTIMAQSKALSLGRQPNHYM